VAAALPMFPTTRRSVILALSSDDGAERARAFDALTAIYWKPLYKYARVAHRRDAADAEDLAQSFLARVFEKESLASYDASKAKFRTFLRTLFDRHAANEMKFDLRLKRGGAFDFASAEKELAREHDRSGTPEDYFHRECARSVFALAVDRVRNEPDFALFDAYDLDDAKISYRELGERFGMNETTVTNRLAAMRRRFRAAVLDILRDATVSESEYQSEVRSLLGVRA